MMKAKQTDLHKHAERVDGYAKPLTEHATRSEPVPADAACDTAANPLILSERDRAVFFDALTNPPVPTERLLKAFAAHRDRVIP